MNIFHGYLESVETTNFRYLDLSHKLLCEILQNYTIGSCKEGQNILDKMFLIIGKLCPILEVLIKIDLLCSPKTGHLFFVHFPDLVIFYREKYESIRILLKKRFCLLLLVLLTLRNLLSLREKFRLIKTRYLSSSGYRFDRWNWHSIGRSGRFFYSWHLSIQKLYKIININS